MTNPMRPKPSTLKQMRALGWPCQPKWDGQRALISRGWIDGGKSISVDSRHGNRIGSYDLFTGIDLGSITLDGELCRSAAKIYLFDSFAPFELNKPFLERTNRAGVLSEFIELKYGEFQFVQTPTFENVDACLAEMDALRKLGPVEGIVARHPNKPYIHGETPCCLKWRESWSR